MVPQRTAEDGSDHTTHQQARCGPTGQIGTRLKMILQETDRSGNNGRIVAKQQAAHAAVSDKIKR